MARLGNAVQWVTRSRLLKEAMSRSPASTPWSRTCLARAAACIALGDAARQPAVPEDLRLPEAVGLYRAACAWLLSAPHGEGRPLEQMLDGRLTEQESSACKAVLLRDAFADGAADPDRLGVEALALHALGCRLREELQAPAGEIRRLRWQRWSRVIGILLLIGAVVFGVQWGVRRVVRGPNLARGKAWRTSSTYAVCDPAHRSCAGVNDLFFHTQDEDQPWFEIDLGAPTSVRRVEITNRRDCCEERSVPLVVELSNDRAQWREVARRKDSFTQWTAEFPKSSTRFVRLRVARRTVFHLEGVAVYR
jgi:hypothetical protein